jgi:ribulose-phosphate 3-epimerase
MSERSERSSEAGGRTISSIRGAGRPAEVTPNGVAPSILAADFARLADQVGAVLEAGARTIHVDVMDGHFVPPISMGALVVDALAEQIHAAGALVDVHLMVEHPERHIDDFAKAGADHITVHAEATPHAHYALQAIRAAGCTAGLALCPATPVAAASELLDDLDLLLCMTVNPGWGGQEFLASSLGKLERLRALLGPGVAIEVDGGIDAETAGPCAAAGATAFVAGSAVFGAADPGTAYREIAAAAFPGSG